MIVKQAVVKRLLKNIVLMRGLPVDQIKIIYLYFLNFILIHLPLIFIFCLILFSVFTKYQTRKRTSKQQIYRLGDISLNKISSWDLKRCIKLKEQTNAGTVVLRRQ